MARLDYNNILTKIRTQLAANAAAGTDLPGNLKIYEESEIIWGPEVTPAIYLYMDRRTAPDSIQRMANGTRTDFRVFVKLWCVQWHFNSVREAAQLRNTLVSQAEVALMADRTLGGAVNMSWLLGGDLSTWRDDDGGGFLSIGDIDLEMEAISVT